MKDTAKSFKSNGNKKNGFYGGKTWHSKKWIIFPVLTRRAILVSESRSTLWGRKIINLLMLLCCFFFILQYVINGLADNRKWRNYKAICFFSSTCFQSACTFIVPKSANVCNESPLVDHLFAYCHWHCIVRNVPSLRHY